MLNTSIITAIPGLRGIRQDWLDLLENSDADNLFLTPDWIDSWLAVVGSSATNSLAAKSPELFVITVYKGDKLVALAPFYLRKVRLFGVLSYQCLRILADENTSSEYLDLIIHSAYENDALDAIAEVIWSNRGRYAFIWIPYAADWKGATKRFQSLFQRAGLLTQSRKYYYHATRLPGGKAEFDAALSAKQRNNIRRYTKKLGSSGSVKLVELSSSMSSDAALKVLISLHEQRWQSQGQTGAFVRKPVFHQFIAHYGRVAAANGALAVLCVYQGDEPIAARYGFIYKNTLYEIQAGFKPTMNGAGVVNIYLAIHYCIDAGFEVYDFLAHEGEYKHRYNAEERSGSSWFAGKDTLLNRLIFKIGLWPMGRYLSWPG
ncbi:MAG: GNAT family N-acetyltransferase [Pseudomonadales bacterium]|nr:GNAT family N-acetyltransferase [Pseudomonadales bacterium]